jgi:ribosomal subunit interface protein
MIHVLKPGTSESSVTTLAHKCFSPGYGVQESVRNGGADSYDGTGTIRPRGDSCVHAGGEFQYNDYVKETGLPFLQSVLYKQGEASFNVQKEAAMNIVVTGRHFTVTDDVRELTETKVENALKVFQRVVRHSRIIVSRENLEYEIEANVELTTKKKILTAIGKDKDLRTALDSLAAKLNEQIRRLKERIEDKHKTVKKTVQLKPVR